MVRAKDIGIVPGEIYHLYGRGVNKRDIFIDNRDYARFLFSLLYLQSNEQIFNVSAIVTSFCKNGVFNISRKKEQSIVDNKELELHSFCIMPNHFHLLVSGKQENSISTYMKRVLGGYGKYFNAKYDQSGHVFQGSYNATHIFDNEHFLYTSAYIHRNPIELLSVKGKYGTYNWSSMLDYAGDSRWGSLIETKPILEQFQGAQEYVNYVRTSPAKENIYFSNVK